MIPRRFLRGMVQWFISKCSNHKTEYSVIHNPTRLILIALTTVLFAGAAYAQQTQLNADVLSRWANSMEDIEEWAGNQDDLSAEDFNDPDNPMDMQASMSYAAEQNPPVRDIITDAGFDSVDQWANVGARAINAYGGLMIREQGGSREQMQSAMDQQLQALSNDPNVTEEQLAQIRQQMEASQDLMNRMLDAPEADVMAVENNRELFDDLYNSSQQQGQGNRQSRGNSQGQGNSQSQGNGQN